MLHLAVSKPYAAYFSAVGEGNRARLGDGNWDTRGGKQACAP